MRDLEFGINAKDKTGPGFDSAEARARRFNGQISNTSTGMNLAATAAKSFAAAFTLTAIENFGRVVRGVITDAADLVDLSNKVGVATGDLQRMQYGFSQAGVAASDIEQILTQWSKRIGDAYTHGGRLAAILKANGVSLTDSEGRLRSSVDLMRSYADLVANAGSDQERMTLATEAFGKAGSSMVLALRDGANGFDELMRSADDAGGVLDDELLQKAGEIDDEFNRMWRNFEIHSKSAILTAVNGIDDLLAKMRHGAENMNMAALGEQMGSLAGSTGAFKGNRPDLSPIDKRISDAFSVTTPIDGDQANAITRALRDRFGNHTVIPADAANRKTSTDAAKDQAKAYNDVIERLREEESLIGLDSTTQKVLTEQRRAGVTATSQQGHEIEKLVRRIEAENAAIELAKKKQQEFQQSIETAFDSVGDTLTSIVDGSDKASTALAKLAVNFALAAAQASIFGSGPLAGIFSALGLSGSAGQSSSFSTNTTLGGFLGYRASGGAVDPWGSYVVGEKGPEILRMGASRGNIVSNEKAFGKPNVVVNLHTKDAASFAKSRAQVETTIARAVSRAQRSL